MAPEGARSSLAGYLLAGLLAMSACVALLSCTPEEKHRALTFFFDGVPPLYPPGGVLEPEAKAKGDAVSAVARPTRPTVRMYVHEPASDNTKCAACHDRAAAFQITKPRTQLCIACHEETPRQFPRMHGPVAIGDCQVCHEAHRSKYEHLVLEPAPALCFRCHERTPDGGKTLGCVRPSDDSTCTKCHSPHGGKMAFFLRARRGDVERSEGDPAPGAREGRQ